MKILLINGLAPTSLNSTSGIFITRRLKELHAQSVQFYSLTPFFEYPWILKVGKTLIGRENIKYPESIFVEGVRFNFAPVKMSLIDFIETRLVSPSKWPELIFEKIFDQIPEERFDLVHAHRAFPHGSVANLIGKKFGIPSVVTAHGSEIHTEPVLKKRLRLPTIQALEDADKAIFVSSNLLEKARSMGYRKNNAVVIPNGIDPDIFKPSPKSPIKKKLRLQKQCVGFVGNLKKVKRADSFPQIFEYINDLCPDVSFLVVGEGDLRNEIEKRCKNLGLDVRFTGRVSPEKVAYFMNAMDVMILPSRNEGWPCVVLEAQACGVPVVGSSNGGIPEAIGEGGSVVKEGESFDKRFAESVVDVLRNPRIEESLTARAKKYSWAKVVSDEIKSYKSVLSGEKT